MNKYSDLTQEEKELVSNGCGAKKLIRPPKIKEFEASCGHHDYLYYKGGGLGNKVRADVLFLAHLLKDCAKLKNVFIMLVYIHIALLYFSLVLLFGHWPMFKYGKIKTNLEILAKARGN